MTEEEMKAWIDKASYQELLSKWRCAGVGSPWFFGAVGDYYSKRMRERREKEGNDVHVAASKAIGWSQ